MRCLGDFMEFAGLTRLEDIVGRLLTQYAELNKKNEMLSVEVAEKKQELGRLHDKILEMHGEKEDVHHRVSSILTKLDAWEQAKGDDDLAPDQEAAPLAEESQKKLFNMGA
jgi:hypothetical protein